MSKSHVVRSAKGFALVGYKKSFSAACLYEPRLIACWLLTFNPEDRYRWFDKFQYTSVIVQEYICAIPVMYDLQAIYSMHRHSTRVRLISLPLKKKISSQLTVHS